MAKSYHPLVSIIIPLYNSESFIAETIESALNQTYKNIEVIIIDDGSKDSSFEVANRYASGQVKVIQQKNKGASAARNHGLSVSKGDYVQFLDADDFLDRHKIAQQLDTLQHYSDTHLIGGTWQRFVKTLDNLYGEVAPNTQHEVQLFDKIQWLIDRPMMIPHTWLVSKKLIDAVGSWDEELSLNDDGEYFYRVIAASSGVVIDRKAKTYYRSFNTASLSSKNGRKAMLSWIRSVRAYKAIMLRLAGEKGNESVNRYFFLLWYWCLNEFDDLAATCKSEMYDPEKIYDLEGKLTYNLAKLIGFGTTKKVRAFITNTKQSPFGRTIILKVKLILGKPAY